MIGLDQFATVYGENATTGAYTDTLKTGLRCRLAHIPNQPPATAPDRAELAAIRNLLWESDYVLPETAQVEVNGTRWNVVAGTFVAYQGPGGAVVYRRADVRRVG